MLDAIPCVHKILYKTEEFTSRCPFLCREAVEYEMKFWFSHVIYLPVHVGNIW
jgi:hypothetical protein